MKSKALGSFLDFKAEIAKQEEEFKKRAAGNSKVVVGGVKRTNKGPKKNGDIDGGVKRLVDADSSLPAPEPFEAARAALEHKAKIYDRLKSGMTTGLSEQQYDALLVDFDPIIEYEDEFGRMRTGRQSEIPQNLMPSFESEAQEDEDEDDVIHNPVNHFPVYEPTEERVAQINEKFSEENNPLNIHYDATREVRAKAAGFYAFSADEETRKQQMSELKTARVETEIIRQETGAVDLKPGEIEGMQAETGLKGRAMEKRKKDIEERRRLIDAKRRKLKNDDTQSKADEPSA